MEEKRNSDVEDETFGWRWDGMEMEVGESVRGSRRDDRGSGN